MSTTINPILTSLDVASLNFTQNCTAVGELFGAQSKSEFTTDITPNFLQLGLPAEYRDSFSDSDLQTYIDDYLYRPGSNFTRAMGQGKVSDARNVCSKEICQTAYGSFTGNPDIAGIGMMVAYGLQIVLFTVGCFIHFVGYIIKKKFKRQPIPPPSRTPRRCTPHLPRHNHRLLNPHVHRDHDLCRQRTKPLRTRLRNNSPHHLRRARNPDCGEWPRVPWVSPQA